MLLPMKTVFIDTSLINCENQIYILIVIHHFPVKEQFAVCIHCNSYSFQCKLVDETI